MAGQETVPINDVSLAMILEFYGAPINVILGKPDKTKSCKVKNFTQRVQRSRRG